MARSSSTARTGGKSTPTGSSAQKTGSKVGKIPKAGTLAGKSARFKTPGQMSRSSSRGR